MKSTEVARIVASRKELIIRDWEQRARRKVEAAREQPKLELRDSLPEFLDRLVVTLESRGSAKECEKNSQVAREHGAHRTLQPGYSLDEVIYEYHLLRAAIIDALGGSSAVDNDSLAIIHAFVDAGVRYAAVEFVADQKFHASEIEDARARVQRQLSEAIEVAKVGFYDWHIPNDRIQFSERMQADWGIKADSPLREIIQAMHPDDRDRVTGLINQAVAEKTPYSTTYRVVRPDGQEVWIQAKGKVSYDSAGKPLDFVGTSIDISEAREAELALAIERRKLDLIIKEAPIGIALLTGPELRFEIANQQWQNLVPNSRAYIGRIYDEVYPELVSTGLSKTIRRVFETGETFNAYEMLVPVANAAGATEDRYYDFSYIRITDSDNVPYGVFSVAADATQKVADRRELSTAKLDAENSGRKLRLALERGGMGIWEIDLRTNVVAFSPEAMALFQIDAQEVDVPELINSMMHPDDVEEINKVLSTAIGAGKPYLHEYRIIRTDGQVRWLRAQGNAVFDGSGKARFYSGAVQDITERKNSERELEKAKLEAELANQTKSSFLANMSHEIRTPLGAILGFTDLLRDRSIANEEREQFLETISRNGKALTKIIDDILDLAKVESGKLEVEAVEVSLFELIGDVVDVFRERTAAKSIYLRSHFSQGAPARILSDPTRLRQILINIVGNAVKFTDRGGVEIEVKTRDVAAAKAHIVIAVNDTGVGMGPEQVERLFQTFMQADNSTTRKYGGTGLGLALSRRLANALGGDLKIDDCSDRGCTFTFDFYALPVLRASPEDGDAKNQDALVSGVKVALSGVRVLLAEDAVDNRLLVQRILRNQGAIVDSADNGVEAVKKALDGDHDIVLMDIQMPEADGYEATRSLRQTGFSKPIIALTAHAMAEERAKTRAAGCDGHLTKPLDQTALVNTILQHVSNKADTPRG